MNVLLLIVFLTGCIAQKHINNQKFPKDFMFGVATSAYQIEGGWNEDGKGESIWDHTVRTNPKFIKDGKNGYVACDSYHRYKEDVAILKDLGVTHYRFSLSWTRILPTGYANVINKPGVTYYKKLIQELKNNGIIPLVTLFHWDLPQNFQVMGGFANASSVDWYSDYARVVFKLFGNDVKYWITMNEPQMICTAGYGEGSLAPSIHSEALLEYQCVHNIIKSHARVWHIYDKEYRPTQNGKISITLYTDAMFPASNKEVDQAAAERLQEFMLGIYANPIYLGDYPEIVKRRVADRSKAEGRSQSRLPEFTDKEIDYIRGTHDFFGLNVYSARIVSDLGYESPIEDIPSKLGDQKTVTSYLPEWENTTTGYLKVVPWTLRSLLNWIKDKYNNPEIFITENGYPSNGDENDDRRTYYIRGYLSAIRDAMLKDNITVLGYTVWSLMDNFEWSSGYTQKYGLYKVNFDSVTKTRTPRLSAAFYKNVIRTRCLVKQCVN